MKNFYVLPVVMALSAIVPVSATPLFGTDLAKFSIVSGGYSSYGASAAVTGEVGAVQYVTAGNGGTSGGDYVNSTNVTSALSQLSAAQDSLNRMQTTVTLSPTVSGILDLAPGVYSASALTTAAGTVVNLNGGGLANPVWVFNIPTYLVTGADTKINIINAGANASVIWNTGEYVAMGGYTSFIGAVISGQYVSQGAGADFACGSVFASSYVSVAAGSSIVSTNCKGNDTWAGSVMGLGASLDIVNGIAVAQVVADTTAPADTTVPTSTDIPEPGSLSMLLAGLGLMGFLRFSKKSA